MTTLNPHSTPANHPARATMDAPGGGSGHIISDLSIAMPFEAITEKPATDHWVVLPYEGEISGKMLWRPVRNHPPDVSIPLPSLGLCKIHIGMYGSATVPIWYNFFGPKPGVKTWNRLHLRLSDEDWFDEMIPDECPSDVRFIYISESLWKTADVTGKSLVFSHPRKEAFAELTTCVAYVRLAPVTEQEKWPRDTKRLVAYFDSNNWGHYVDSVADVKSHLAPLKDSDFGAVFWTTCREDTCYYPTHIGNRMSDNGALLGVYPYWAGRDMQRMLDRGEDPLRVVCDVGHELGLKVFSSYRRMTCRMPPFVFPLHPNALLLRRRDLWCADAMGDPVPHLSLTHPEVRNLMVSLLSEQAENYDVDGVHMYFSRGVPFVFFEAPFVDAFQKEHGIDPRSLPIDDQRVWKFRARFVLQYLRELRASLDRIGSKKGKRFEIALSVMSTPRTCAFYGMDIESIVREDLADLLSPNHAHFLPPELGEWQCLSEAVAEFAKITRGSGTRLFPHCEAQYSTDGKTIADRAAAFYSAGAEGLQVSPRNERKSENAVQRRLGHIDQLSQADHWKQDATRVITIRKVAGLRLDMHYGIPTCG